MIFLLNFAVTMLQLLRPETDYRHREILIPAFVLAFCFSAWWGLMVGWREAVPAFGLVFVTRFFVSSLRVTAMILTGTEIKSEYWYKVFVVMALVEMAAVFFMIKCFL